MLYGPTSSGKTAASLRIGDDLRARGLRPVVLNADSRQVYRGMDVGTSKIRPADMRGIEHRLLDIADPARKLPLETYLAGARAVLDELAPDSDAVPIVVGGTGVYVRGIRDAWEMRGTSSLVRSLRSEFPRSQVAEAYAMLRRLSPGTAARVRVTNYDAIVNALARLMGPGEGERAVEAPFAFRVLGVDAGRRAVEASIARVLDAQVAGGLLEETGRLDDRLHLVDQWRERGLDAPSVVLATHGYREYLYAAADSGVPVRNLSPAQVAAATEIARDHVVRYSRRQRTWFAKLGVRAAPGEEAAGVAHVLRERQRDGRA
jgi:tRNA A37 N6-isopentenylltransferase MiaA